VTAIATLPDGKKKAVLGDPDWYLAEANALHRYSESRRLGLQGKASAYPTMDMDIQNRAARVAFDRAYNLEPDLKINDFHPGEEQGIYVRSTRYPHGKLIIRKDDRDEDVYVLAVGQDREWALIGFLTGAEAKQRGIRYTENGRPDCWMVAQSKLRPLSELHLPL
jgi:hypothetical protein